jgi:two-component system, cell cycle response regulator DivK
MSKKPVTPTDKNGKPLVLIVEDHADTRTLLRYLIEAHNCAVAEAEDGEQAVQLAELLVPDLILMDTSLPRLDGFEATRRIRGLHGERRVPIIFISGYAQPEYRAAALATGGDDYFVKPIDVGELEMAMERRLQSTPVRAVSRSHSAHGLL